MSSVKSSSSGDPISSARRCPHCGRAPLQALAVSVKTACRLIGIGKTSWYKLQSLGLGPPVSRPPAGGHQFVRVAALKEWLQRWEGSNGR